jgi:hypothetical protein
VEHELGRRAQLAYPKSLFVAHDTLPFTFAVIASRLKRLIAYRRTFSLPTQTGISRSGQTIQDTILQDWSTWSRRASNITTDADRSEP